MWEELIEGRMRNGVLWKREWSATGYERRKAEGGVVGN